MSKEIAQELVVPLDPSPARRPARTVITGRLVTLAPLNPSVHGDSLWAGVRSPDHNSLWQYLFDGPFADQTAFNQNLRLKAAADDPLFFAIVDHCTGWCTGYASYMRVEPVHRSLEVGGILFTPAFQRTAGATEAMYLMARHAFDDLAYRRYEWKCDVLNLASRRAAIRLGFFFEGIFRQHMIVKGRNRDTAWFSMLDREWPARKAALERWLDPQNFDEDGRQRRELERSTAIGAA